jgi:predicted RNA-binding protein YlxR (DUF448 family)
VPHKDDIERQCCLTREVRPAAELIRFVVSPEGELWPDVDARADGRGVWVTATADAVAEAGRRKAFARSLKGPVVVPPDLAERTRGHLEQRLLGALGLARKAGQIATGFTRVEKALRSGEAIALLTATDAADDGRNKLVGLLHGLGIAAGTPHLQILTSDQMGLALGLDNVIHAALTNGAAARSALVRAERLARFIAPKETV